MKAVITCAIALTALSAFASPAKAQGPGCDVEGQIQLCGFVWNDLNGDGVQNEDADLSDGDQSGLNGVKVELYVWDTANSKWDDTPTIAETTDGFYTFNLIPDGTYKIVVYSPSIGMQPTCIATAPECPLASADNTTDSDGINDGGTSVVSNIIVVATTNKDFDFGFHFNGVVSPGTGTPGYWKNHLDAWGDSGLLINGRITIGIETFTPQEAAALMGKVSKDKRISLFSQLVSAMLNVGIGNDESCIGGYITAANNWMKTHPFATTGAVAASSPAWQGIADAHQKLDDYNNGRLCAPHRN
jgi:hypothetical protein